jgi:dissimilatory sulfite reductase (desulfoviridin) alpha/beta subunit
MRVADRPSCSSSEKIAYSIVQFTATQDLPLRRVRREKHGDAKSTLLGMGLRTGSKAELGRQRRACKAHERNKGNDMRGP